MEKNEAIQYKVEREFLGKITVKEFLIRIIKTHLNTEKQKGNLI